MNGLEDSNYQSPEPKGEALIGPENQGKFRGSPVSKNPTSEIAKKVDSVTDDQTPKKGASTQGVRPQKIISMKVESPSKESEEIQEKILKILGIMKKGKSMQGYPGEVLSYEGYQILEQIKERQARAEPLSPAENNLLKASDISETSKAISSIKKTLQDTRSSLIKGLEPQALANIAAVIKAGNATDDQVRMVVDCKKLWMNLATEEGSYLELLNFVGKKDFEELKIIKEIAFMQGPQVDMQLNKTILEDHLKNKPQGKPPMRILIEGAGPNGLYAAFQFFRSGASVSVVNDRGEITIRNQNMILDPKWIAHLNFLLGSKFDDLFNNPKALGVLNLQRGSGTIKTRVLENIMKIRAAEISSYIEDAQSSPKETFLNLHFEAPLRGVQTSDKGFSAIIGEKRTPEAEMFQILAIEGKTKKILSKKYANFQPEDVIENRTVLSMAQDEANAQWQEEQAKAKIEKPAIIFDFLACIGGANDTIRDEFLEPAIPLTESKSYGIASWLKPESQADKKYFSQDILNSLSIRTDNLGYPYLTRQHIEKSLKSQEIDQLLSATSLPEQFKRKYENFTEKLLKNIETTHLPDVESDQNIRGFNIRTFENYATVFLAASTPPFLADFFQDLNQLIASSRPPENLQLKNFKKEMDRKWMNSIAGVFAIDPNVLKLDDEYAINFGTFEVQQKGIDTAAKLLQFGEFYAVIAAFGDSRTSPHFFSGSGMSSARLGIEYGAEVIREFNQKATPSKKDFVSKLDASLDLVKEKTIEKGRRFVKANDPSERKAAKYLMLKNKINENFNLQRETPSKQSWKIDSTVNDEGEFGLSFTDKKGKQQSLNVKISQEDGKLHAKGKKYLVLNDLLLDLD